MNKKFKYESELCDEFVKNNEKYWDIYPECFGFDLYLFKKDGDIQIGIEAKLSPNLKVLYQILDKTEYVNDNFTKVGPHYRGILVPDCDDRYYGICKRLNIIVLKYSSELIWRFTKLNCDRSLQKTYDNYDILQFKERHVRPEIALQSSGGLKSPKCMSNWRINALKLIIKYYDQGYVTSTDIKEVGLSVSTMKRWFEYKYREPKIGRCFKMALKEEDKSPAKNYEKELELLRNKNNNT